MKSKLSPKISKMVLLATGPAILSGAYAYANTLTGLIPDLYAGLDVVSRELVGMIPSITRNASAERAAVGENITYPIAPSLTSSNVTPAMAIPEPTDRTIGYGQMTISKAKLVEFGFVGEEQRGLNNGPGYLTVQADLFAQALRTLTNEIEVDLTTAGALGASRAFGTATTAPFATTVGDSAQIRKILDDNGAPPSARSLVITTGGGAALRTLGQLTKANEAGTIMTLRDGELLNLNGLSIKESNGIVRPTSGTGASATTDNAGYAVGATVLTLASAGTGTIIAGDVVTFAGDANKYVVASGDADTSNGGTITLAAPGLRVAMSAATKAITVVAISSRNLAFSQDAIHLVARAPALPKEGDAAIDRFMLVDPRSGLPFEVSLYAGYRKIRAEVAMAWGYKVVKTAHTAILLGE